MKKHNMELIHQFINGRSGSDVYLARQINQIGVYKTKIKNAK